MSNEFHKDLVDDDLHALPAATYADITARDADTDFQVTANIDKMVRVDSPVSYYILVSIGLAVWIEATNTENDTLAEILAVGNTTGGTDLSVSTGDDITFADSASALFGDGSDLNIRHSGTNSVITSSTGDLIIDNTNANGATVIRLGADDADPSFQVQNDSGNPLFLISSDGTNTTWESDFGELSLINGSGGEFLFDDDSFHTGISVTEALQLGHTALAGFINSIGTGELQFQHDGATLLTLSDTGKLSIPLDLTTPQFTIGANDDFQFFHNGITSHIQNFVGDLKVTVVTGDLVIETTIDGHFLFTTNEFRAGVSTSEYLSIGHDGTDSFVNAVGDGTIQFQHEGTTVMTLSDGSILNFPIAATLSTTTGDITVTTGSGGDFLFGSNGFRAGLSTSEFLNIGHDGSNSFINSVGDGVIEFKHEGVSVMSLSDAHILNFTTAATISTTAGDLTLNPDSEVNISSDLNFDGGGNINIKRAGETVLTLDTSNNLNTSGDLFTFDVSAADFSGNNLSVTQEVTAPEIRISETFTFHEGSTQHVAAIPDLRSGRIKTALFNQSTDVSTEEANPQHIYMRVDGLKLYLIGEGGNAVDEFDMTIPWDTSTLTHLQTFSVATQDTGPKGIFFKPDGLRMYVTGTQNNSVYQYDLGTAWNISTATFDTSVSVSTDTPNPASIVFQPDGSTFFIVAFNAGTNALTHYGMSTLWDVSTASFLNGFSPSEPSTLSGVAIRSDGALLYLSDTTDDTIYEYLLGTPWNTTANTKFLGKLDLTGDNITATRGIFFSPFYDKMYFPDPAADVIHEYDMGVLVEGKIQSGPSNIVEIYSANDLLDQAVSDVWTISEDTTLDWKGDVTGSVRFSINDGITLHIDGSNRSTAKYTYEGADVTDCFSGEGAVRMFGMKNWDSTETARFANLTAAGNPGTGGTLNIRDCLNITGWVMGNTNGQVFGIDSVFVDVSNGFDFTNPTLINITDWAIEGTTLGTDFISVVTDNPASIMNFTDMSGLSLSASGALFNFSGKSNNNARFSVKNCKVAKNNDGLPIGHIFEQNASGTGTVTAVVEGTISNGTITAQADNGSSGTTHSCTTTYFEDEEVLISSTTNYNGTFQIFNVVAGVSFDTITTFVANDASGSVGSDRLTVTLSGGHPITATDDLKWIEGNFYNGFYTALNVVTNTLTLNGVFVGTDTGTLDDDVGLDQSDPRVVAIGNSPFVDSHYIATTFVNNNSTANGTIVNNTFTDMVFGTAGSALIAGSTMERWRLIDELNGTFEYFGNEPFDGDITFDFTVTSSGGTVEFRFKWEIDIGSGFADLPDPVEALIDVASNTRSISKTFPLAASKGNQIKPQITRNSGSSSITTSYATIYASQ